MTTARRTDPAIQATLFFALALAGLAYVKWVPYYGKGLLAASHHAIGASILMGKASAPPRPSVAAALSYGLAYGKAIWQALVLGLLLGSGVQALLPPDWVAKALGGRRFPSALAGGFLALPGMMCTCCAAPVVAGLRKSRAGAGAAIAFWLGNSVLNPATLIFMGFVLGWRWSLLRLALGAPMVFGLGYLANRMTSPAEAAEAEAAITGHMAPPPSGPFKRWLSLLTGMTLRLVPEYVILVLVLGAGRAWLFPAIGPGIDNHLGWIIAFAIAGMVFVIPTAGEVPIIQAMLGLGLGVGPAAALLMTLPPISLPSMAMLARSFPPRILAMVGVSVVLFGVAAGVLAMVLQYTGANTPT